MLDGAEVPLITAFLYHRGGHSDPARLSANEGKGFMSSKIYGAGFTFDDKDTRGVASPLAEMHRLVEAEPRNRDVISPYIGGAELNTSPTHAHHRHVIDYRDWPLRRELVQAHLPTRTGGSAALRHWERTAHRVRTSVHVDLPTHGESTPEGASESPRPPDRDRSKATSAQGTAATPWSDANDEQRRRWLRSGIVPGDYPGPVAADWPALLQIVEQRVKPERLGNRRETRRRRWWLFGDRQPALFAAIAELDRVLAISSVGQHAAFAFLPSRMVFSHALTVFALSTHAAFCALQARPHELWARFFGSSLEERLRYNSSDCFDTFPFPDNWEARTDLEAAGKTYNEHRTVLMIENDEGMTKTYNRFHDPAETGPTIQRLRDLHAAMDRTVLTAYGWNDIPTDCEFLLDYEIDEEARGNKKKPYRYRWPDEVRDEVLARLLELNAQRAAAEEQTNLT